MSFAGRRTEPTLPTLMLAVYVSLALPATLDLTFPNGDASTFEITLDGQKWLSGSEVIVDGRSFTAKTLVPVRQVNSTGVDQFGAFNETAVSWAHAVTHGPPPATVMIASYKTYPADPSIIVFSQSFTNPIGATARQHELASKIESGLGGGGGCRVVAAGTAVKFTKSVEGHDAWMPTSGGGHTEGKGSQCETSPQRKWSHTGSDNQTACKAKCAASTCACFDWKNDGPTLPGQLAARTIFPGFDSAASSAFARRDLDCFSHYGVFAKMESCQLSTYRSGHVGGSPLVIYDSTNTSLPMTVFSALDKPLAHAMAHSDKMVGAGIKATAQAIPRWWTQSFILSAGRGIKSGMMNWGDHMLAFTGKAERADMCRHSGLKAAPLPSLPEPSTGHQAVACMHAGWYSLAA